MRNPLPVWPAALLLAPPAIACAAPGQDACMARAGASLDALVRGDFAGAARDFSAGLGAALPAAKLRETWAQVTGMAGAYRSHGAPRRQTLRGQSVMVIPVVFAQRPLDFVTACDASGHLSAFYLLEPSVVDAPPPVVASTGADGVRVRPLDVPSPAGPLRGALTLPAGTGPFPAVVLVAGSGPHDMDETIGPNQPFLDLANRLARVGIASLRYDKRTFDYAPQTAANPDFTIDDEVTDDALTALHLLAQQQSIDPRRVFVLGHSLGAQMAPRIATRDAQPAGVIMLAAPARPFLDVIATQLRELGPRQGLSTAELDRREQAIAAERKLVVRCRSESAARGNVRAVAGELIVAGVPAEPARCASACDREGTRVTAADLAGRQRLPGFADAGFRCLEKGAGQPSQRNVAPVSGLEPPVHARADEIAGGLRQAGTRRSRGDHDHRGLDQGAAGEVIAATRGSRLNWWFRCA